MKEEYDLSNVDISNISPTIGLPLLNTDINFSNLIEIDTESSDFIEYDSTNLLHITTQQELATITVGEPVDIEDQEISELVYMEAIPIDNIDIQESITMGSVLTNLSDLDGQTAPIPAVSAIVEDTTKLPKYESFESGLFGSGTMTLEIENNWPIELTNFNVYLTNSDNSIIATFSFASIPANSTQSKTVSVVNKQIKSEVQVVFGQITSPGSPTIAVPINLSNALNFTFSSANLEIDRGRVKFPNGKLFEDTAITELGLDTNQNISGIVLENGSFNYTMFFQMDNRFLMNIQILNAFKDGQYFNETFEITPNFQNTGQVDLSGYEFVFTDENPGVITSITSATPLDTSDFSAFSTEDLFSSTIQFADLELAYVKGYFGSDTIEFESDPIDFSFDTDIIPGDLTFAAPSVSLTFNNSIGLPLELDLQNMSTLNANGDSMNFEGALFDSPTQLNSPDISTPYDSITTVVNIDTNSSNIVEIIASTPSQIIPDIQVIMNPDGETSTPNFITNQSKLSVDLNLDIPFYASLANLKFNDTIPLDLGDANLGGQQGELHIAVDNGFPIECILQLYFMNASMDTLDSLMTGNNIIASASIDNDGNIETSSQTKFKLDLNQQKLNNLLGSSYIFLDILIQTPNNGTTPVKFYLDRTINVQLGLVTDINLGG